MLVKIREEEVDCRRFDNTLGTPKHRATELFNERHGLLTGALLLRISYAIMTFEV